MTMSPGPFDLLVLAGGSSGSLAQLTGANKKALVPLLDRPLFEWTLQALQSSGVFRKVLVAGPCELRHYDLGSAGWCPSTGSAVLNTLLYANYLRLQSRSPSNCFPIVISCCDAPLLTPSLVRSTLKAMGGLDADIVVNLVSKETIDKLAPRSQRTFWSVDGLRIKPSVMFLIKNPLKLWKCLFPLLHLRQWRKSPARGLQILGDDTSNLADILERLCRMTGQRVAFLKVDHPELAIDVDKPSDLIIVREILQARL